VKVKNSLLVLLHRSNPSQKILSELLPVHRLRLGLRIPNGSATQGGGRKADSSSGHLPSYEPSFVRTLPDLTSLQPSSSPYFTLPGVREGRAKTSLGGLWVSPGITTQTK
jgi:hypothetical protein